MSTNIKLITLAATLIVLNGCATMTSGQSQALSVDTGKDCGAKCTLTNDKGIWHVTSTPEIVNIDRDFGDLTVSCHKAGKIGKTTVSSSPNAATLGNIILPGALVATAIDVASGSAFEYPEQIEVKLAAK